MNKLSILLCEFGKLETGLYKRICGPENRSEVWGVFSDKSWLIKKVPREIKRILKKQNDPTKINS